MTVALTAPTPTTLVPPPRPTLARRYLRETALLVGRSLRMIPRLPERLSDVTIQPIIFTLLFLYVFGSAIHIPGMRYQDYLLPGLLAQNLGLGIIGSGTATANDFASGVIDRFRSLPISRLAVITAQVLGQMIEQVLGLLIVAAVGFALGWRPHANPMHTIELIGVFGLGLLAFTTFGILLGLLVRSPDAVQGVGFAVALPLSFLAGAFVPISGMKTVPRVIGLWDPLSAFVAAIRYLTAGTHARGSWQLEHPIAATTLWSALLMAVCVPLTLRRFSSRG